LRQNTSRRGQNKEGTNQWALVVAAAGKQSMLQTGQRDPSTRKINNTVAIQRIIHFSKGGRQLKKGRRKNQKKLVLKRKMLVQTTVHTRTLGGDRPARRPAGHISSCRRRR